MSDLQDRMMCDKLWDWILMMMRMMILNEGLLQARDTMLTDLSLGLLAQSTTSVNRKL